MKQEQEFGTVTIKGLAEALNISTASVSVALSNKPGVSESLRKKVREMALVMGYVPNNSARQLVSGRSNKVGFFSHRVDAAEGTTDSFHFNVFNHLINELSQHGMYIIYDIIDEGVDFNKIRFEIKQEKLAGAVVFGLNDSDPNFSEFERVKDCPIVILDQVGTSLLNSVSSDHKQAISMVFNYLLKTNHKKIVIVSGSEKAQVTKLRDELAISEAKKHEQIEKIKVYHSDFTARSACKIVNEILSELDWMPDAIFCHSDYIAQGAIKALVKNGIKVPEEVSVIGFDDVSLAKYIGIDGLTTVRQDTKKIATEICDLIVNNKIGQSRVVPVEFVTRSTSARKK